jgi:uncharacterized protein
VLSAGWAIAAVHIGGRTFAPGSLGLGELDAIRWLADHMTTALASGAVGLVAGLVLAWNRARKPGATQRARGTRWRARLAGKVVPDYGPLLPESRRERLWFVAVSVSAGICEEIVYRGWLLAFLHGTCGLDGSLLIVAAAALFGLGHVYQGVLGVVGTAYVGAVLAGLYVASGSLLLPIILHVLIDVRSALPSRPRSSSRPIEEPA